MRASDASASHVGAHRHAAACKDHCHQEQGSCSRQVYSSSERHGSTHHAAVHRGGLQGRICKVWEHKAQPRGLPATWQRRQGFANACWNHPPVRCLLLCFSAAGVAFAAVHSREGHGTTGYVELLTAAVDMDLEALLQQTGELRGLACPSLCVAQVCSDLTGVLVLKCSTIKARAVCSQQLILHAASGTCSYHNWMSKKEVLLIGMTVAYVPRLVSAAGSLVVAGTASVDVTQASAVAAI